MPSIGLARARQRGILRIGLAAPVIYIMVIPIVFLDLCISTYQAICFRLYGIPRVARRSYVRWIPRGKNLPWIDRFNCGYCSYANGVGAYFSAVLIETEKYWCPLKYSMRKGYTIPNPQEPYAAEGDDAALEKILKNPPSTR